MSDASPSTVVFLSHTADLGTFKVGSHHLAREFSRMGFRVGHISTPYSYLHQLKGRLRRARNERASRAGTSWVDDAGVVHYVPMQLLPAQVTFRCSVRRQVIDLGFELPDYVFIDQPLMVPRGARGLARTVVYRPTDSVSGIAQRMQSRIVRDVAGVAATAEEVLDRLHLAREMPRTVIPNGVELARFSGSVSGRRDGFVYVGAMDGRFDWAGVVELAERVPNERVWLFGPGSHGPEVHLPPNIIMKGPISYVDVPDVLKTFKVGLMPFNDDQLNQGRSPMKYYEYLASGLYVIAKRTTELGHRETPGVWLYSTYDELAQAASAALVETGPNVAGVSVAEAEDWAKKARDLLDFAQRCEVR